MSAHGESSVTLYLDDGRAENGLFRVGDGMGHTILFEAPSGDWNLSSVAIYGKLDPENVSGIDWLSCCITARSDLDHCDRPAGRAGIFDCVCS